jgi:hypothetical protein
VCFVWAVALGAIAFIVLRLDALAESDRRLNRKARSLLGMDRDRTADKSRPLDPLVEPLRERLLPDSLWYYRAKYIWAAVIILLAATAFTFG